MERGGKQGEGVGKGEQRVWEKGGRGEGADAPVGQRGSGHKSDHTEDARAAEASAKNGWYDDWHKQEKYMREKGETNI